MCMKSVHESGVRSLRVQLAQGDFEIRQSL